MEGNENKQADERAASVTARMTLAERIAHVGGRGNAAGYIEFGSVMAVNALIQHALRDAALATQQATKGDERAACCPACGGGPVTWKCTCDPMWRPNDFASDQQAGALTPSSSACCPFCGSDDYDTQSALGRIQVVCNACEAAGPTEETDDEAIAAWQRVAPSPIAGSAGQALNGWRSVVDCLPDDGQIVAVFDPRHPELKVWPAQWDAENQAFTAGSHKSAGWFEKDEVTHWTPLPTAPSLTTDAGAALTDAQIGTIFYKTIERPAIGVTKAEAISFARAVLAARGENHEQ